MSIVERYSAYAEDNAKAALELLLTSTDDPKAYSGAMESLGRILGGLLNERIPRAHQCLLASTAEDADFLTRGIYDLLREGHVTKAAIFWNNHYSVPGGSVAPVVHKFLEPGYESTQVLVIAKSVISGSCVVRTNLLELIENINPHKIYIVAPVMHSRSQATLCEEFPAEISDKFEFLALAIDKEKNAIGEVVPGIGGEIYPLLGLEGQPARKTYMPNLVRQLAAI